MVADPDHNVESLAAWNANAAFWDDVQGDEGNEWQRTLVFPATLELLLPLPNRLLELACGNGNFARTAARLGLQVTATDGSAAQLERAQSRTDDPRIAYRQVDVTDPDAIADIPGAPYDAAVCNMALMDIADIEPLFAALPALLRPDAPFVCSLLHPAFNLGPATMLFAERFESEDGQLITRRGVKLSGYASERMQRGIAVVGQPQLQPYFQRSLQTLFTTAFRHGWVIDGLREPTFPLSGPTDHAARLRWEDVPEIPPVLLVRYRRS